MEEGGDDVKSSWSLYPGLHTSYSAHYSGKLSRKVEQILQRWARFGLRAEIRPHEGESLVIADQHAAVNTFSGLVHTARQAMEVHNT